MDVNRTNFALRLLDILEDISKCSFLALDFEFSGIATRAVHASGKQTLEERYRDVKVAAERYQILQIGFTFAIYDDEREVFVLKPYNMNLSPLLDEKLSVERVFSFQSSALEFLLRHGFNLEEPFKNGVPYLSREEAALAKKLAYNRLERKHVEDMNLRNDDVEALAFLDGLRKRIGAWKEDAGHELEITSRQELINRKSSDDQVPPNADASTESPQGLSRFEKRLVHQLVRAEYPDLVTISRDTSVRIIPLDEEREREFLRKRKRGVREQISRHTGFRWIVDALTNQLVNGSDSCSLIAVNDAADGHTTHLRTLQTRFGLVQDKLKTKEVPLVGHNVFTDLVYFYRTFIGPLPDTAREFVDALHELFPMVIDTKYIATHNCGDINPTSSLQAIETTLRSQKGPIVETHRLHTKYTSTEALHEAGYDSYLTALVAIRLSAKLNADGAHVKEIEDNGSKDQAPKGVAGLLKNIYEGVSSLASAGQVQAKDARKKLRQGTTTHEKAGLDTNTTTYKEPDKPVASLRFASANLFERLGELSVTDEDSPPEPNERDARDRNGADTATPSQKSRVSEGARDQLKMPSLDADFWHVYGNKLRIFGTVEGLLDLAGKG